jgi:hypothetical protein
LKPRTNIEALVGGIGLLKPDLEGYDYLILHAFLDLLENEQTKLEAQWPSVVLYEDEHGAVGQKQKLEARFQRLGYTIHARTTKDVVMQRVCVPCEAGSAMENWREKSTARAMRLLEKSAATNQRCNLHREHYYTHHTPLPAGCLRGWCAHVVCYVVVYAVGVQIAKTSRQHQQLLADVVQASLCLEKRVSVPATAVLGIK